MNASYAAAHVAPLAPTEARRPLGIVVLRLLLLAEAAVMLAASIGLSMLAGDAGETTGRSAEEALRFAAAGAFIVAVAAAAASRGARRARAWSWTVGALLQVAVAGGTAAALLIADWHPAFLAGFALPGAVMLALSSGPVRRYLGQH